VFGSTAGEGGEGAHDLNSRDDVALTLHIGVLTMT